MSDVVRNPEDRFCHDTDHLIFSLMMQLESYLSVRPDSWGECGSSMVERGTPEREVRVRNVPLLCCVLEQDTLLPESTDNPGSGGSVPT